MSNHDFLFVAFFSPGVDSCTGEGRPEFILFGNADTLYHSYASGEEGGIHEHLQDWGLLCERLSVSIPTFPCRRPPFPQHRRELCHLEYFWDRYPA